MPGVPTSTACLECKARHLKCDEQKPSCERCVKSGIRCPGYRKVTKFIEFKPPVGLKKTNFRDATTSSFASGSPMPPSGENTLVASDKDPLEGREFSQRDTGYSPAVPVFDAWELASPHSFGSAEKRFIQAFAVEMSQKFRVFGKEQWTNPMANAWVAGAVKDQVLVNAIITISSLYLGLVTGSSLQRHFQYKGGTIKMIHGRISDTSKASSDETLAAISIFAIIPGLFGLSDEFISHMKGVVQLLNIRGGYQSLSSNPWLQVTVRCADISGICLLGTPARIPVDTKIEDEEANILPSSIESSQMASRARVEEFVLAFAFSSEVGWALRKLTMLIEFAETSRLQASGEQMIRYFQTITWVMNTMLMKSGVHQMGGKNSRVQRICCLAGLLFCSFRLMGYQPPMPIFALHGRELKALLSEGDMVEDWKVFPDILLSILFTSCHASLGQQERPWFIAQLNITLRRLSVTSWAGVRLSIENFLFAKELTAKYEPIWNEACQLTKLS